MLVNRATSWPSCFSFYETHTAVIPEELGSRGKPPASRLRLHKNRWNFPIWILINQNLLFLFPFNFLIYRLTRDKTMRESICILECSLDKIWALDRERERGHTEKVKQTRTNVVVLIKLHCFTCHYKYPFLPESFRNHERCSFVVLNYIERN